MYSGRGKEVIMAEENKHSDRKCRKGVGGGGASGAIYGLGFIGAAVFFIQHANSFGAGIWGVLKALVWPALLVYKALEVFKM